MNLGIYHCKHCKAYLMPNVLGRMITCFCFENTATTTGFYITPSYFDDKGQLMSWQGGNVANKVVIRKPSLQSYKETLQ